MKDPDQTGTDLTTTPPTTTTADTALAEAHDAELPVAAFSETDLVRAPAPELPSERWLRRRVRLIGPVIGVSVLSSVAVAALYASRVVGGSIGIAFALTMPVVVSSLTSLLTPKKTFKQTAAFTALVHLVTAVVSMAVAGEGTICLLMATPLLYCASVSISVLTKGVVENRIDDLDKKHRALLGVVLALCLPFLAHEIDARVYDDLTLRAEVRSQVAVPMAPEVVWSSLQHLELRFVEPEPWTWAWLLPRPRSISGDGARTGAVRAVRFDNGTVEATVTALDPPRRYDIELVVRDAGREFFDHWIDLKTSRFDIEPLAGGGSLVVHATRYRPLLHPRLVFEPIEQYFGQQIGQHLLDVYAAQVLPQVSGSGAPLAKAEMQDEMQAEMQAGLQAGR